MTHTINLLEKTIHENKVELSRMAKRKDQLIGELTVLHLQQRNLQSSTDQMESELKTQYDTERSKWENKPNASIANYKSAGVDPYANTQDKCASVSPSNTVQEQKIGRL